MSLEEVVRIVYADNNTTTKVAPEVYEAMIPFLTGEYFNPSSMYDAATPARCVSASVAIRDGISATSKHFYSSGLCRRRKKHPAPPPRD